MVTIRATTQDPELADRFNRVLGEVVEALDAASVPHVFIGGIASGGLGRPRSTRDIDIFVQPEQAELALRALAKRGFRTEKTDPIWLFKGFKEDILVDVIFKSKGEIFLDSEMFQRAKISEFHGRRLRLVSPEDLIIIKAAAHSEETPSHWHDALAVLAHSEIDWAYLVKRARRAPRRVLSLLLYAHSTDIWVPREAIDQLYAVVFGASELSASAGHRLGAPFRAVNDSLASPHPGAGQVPVARELRLVPPWREVPDRQGSQLARLRERLAEDPRTNELDIQLGFSRGRLQLRGEVMTHSRRAAVTAIAREVLPDVELIDQIQVVELRPARGSEDVI